MNYNNSDFSKDDFNKAFFELYNILTRNITCSTKKNAYILGGQPGSGKSAFYNNILSLSEQYIQINGDQYRKFHPRYHEIVKCDIENYAQRTQMFANAMVEKMISTLSAENYNMVIEGTLRDPNVPIKTCNKLRNCGYKTNLVIIACDTEKSWESTIERAKIMQEIGEKPRIVPIDKYNDIVNNFIKNAQIIDDTDCFSNIAVVNRFNKILYKSGDNTKLSEILKKELNIEKWNKNFQKHLEAFIDAKIQILQKEKIKIDKNR